MAYEMKDGQGSLFQNDKKQSEKSPDFKGKIKLNGKMYDLSAWTRLTKNGQEFLSVHMVDEWVPKGSGSGGSTPRSNYASNPPAMSAAAMDDVIPF